MNSDWYIEMNSLNVKQHPAIVLVILACVSIDVHFPIYPIERQRLLIPSKIDENNNNKKNPTRPLHDTWYYIAFSFGVCFVVGVL